MRKNILLVILDKFTDWEAAYVSTGIRALSKETYLIKTVSLTKEPVYSLGGFTVMPDYDIDSVDIDFEGVILIGGMSWRKDEAKTVGVLVKKALDKGKVVGGICDASVFLGAMGFLNNVKHTSNLLEDLKNWAKEAYTNEKNYKAQPAVRDKNIITANGTATLEFAKEIITALNIVSEDKIKEWYDFYKLGCYNAPMPQLM